jgi:menaquinone-dependent protoporphyrinogen oxidase
MRSILFLYSTVDGQTLKICARLKQVVEASGHQATLAPLGEPAAPALEAFDKIVIGASVRYGKHRPAVAEFIRANRRLLDARPSAFFSVSIVARKPGRDTPQTNPYVKTLLRQALWRPRLAAVFAGMLDYPRYGFRDRLVIRFIMLLTRGPTDPRAVVEFTDWSKVDAFGRSVAAL